MSSEIEKLELALKQTKKLLAIAPRSRTYRASGADVMNIENQITRLQQERSAAKRKKGRN